MKNHSEVCEYNRSECRYCGELIKKNDLEQHEEECDLRKIQCLRCQVEIEQRNKHYDIQDCFYHFQTIIDIAKDNLNNQFNIYKNEVRIENEKQRSYIKSLNDELRGKDKIISDLQKKIEASK